MGGHSHLRAVGPEPALCPSLQSSGSAGSGTESELKESWAAYPLVVVGSAMSVWSQDCSVMWRRLLTRQLVDCVSGQQEMQAQYARALCVVILKNMKSSNSTFSLSHPV